MVLDATILTLPERVFVTMSTLSSHDHVRRFKTSAIQDVLSLIMQ